MKTATPKTSLTDSPLYLLAVLHSARMSGDRALEKVTSARLAKIGVSIRFAKPKALRPEVSARG